MLYSFNVHVSKGKNKASGSVFTFLYNLLCLEVLKTFLLILELRFPMKQTKDILSRVPKDKVGLSNQGQNTTKLGTRKLLEALGPST